MATKKIVFIIVEGPSDSDALGLLFDRIFSSNTVFVHITHMDVTTSIDSSGNYVRGRTILNRVGNIVETYMNAYHKRSSQFKEIIHITDMDGAYIPQDTVVFDSNAKKAKYEGDKILTAKVKAIQERNSQKRGCLDKLSTTPKIHNIPYHIYYMSCNLDHVLHNKRNLSNGEKESLARAFSKKYRDDIPSFIRFINDSKISVSGSFLETWAFIKEGLNSLERHTNLGLCFKGSQYDVD